MGNGPLRGYRNGVGETLVDGLKGYGQSSKSDDASSSAIAEGCGHSSVIVTGGRGAGMRTG